MLDAEFMGWSLARCDLSSCAIPVRLYTLPSAAWTQFILEQYRCINGAVTIEASPGDIVIDAGGCWGDTALYFANKIGAEGRVFTFEFMDRHLAIMEKNFSLNHHLRDRISVIHHALWDRSGQPLTYSDNGPATAVSERKAGPNTTYTISVDDFVESAGLPRIDFIKMDIEGAELGALKGAEQTIRRWRPKLAICVYHKLEDFFEIPEYLASLDVGYELFLRHYSATAGETVLFASPQAGSSSL
jgi:FkbM family methyltransferase